MGSDCDTSWIFHYLLTRTLCVVECCGRKVAKDHMPTSSTIFYSYVFFIHMYCVILVSLCYTDNLAFCLINLLLLWLILVVFVRPLSVCLRRFVHFV